MSGYNSENGVSLPRTRASIVAASGQVMHVPLLHLTDFSGVCETSVPRLLDREGAYHQSIGRMKIKRINTGRWHLRHQDPFHSLVNISTGKLYAVCVLIISGSWVLFAGLFRMVSHNCGLGANTMLKAFYLAIETIETIGYGVSDPYFEGCWSGAVVLSAAALWESVLNAVLISIIYTRISRSQNRAVSIVFTEKALLVEMHGAWFFMFQVCDFRKHQVCEAHVRLYAVQHGEDEGVSFQTRAMRLEHPDDSLGGMLLLALPQLVVHRIDAWSPLCPKKSQWTSRSSRATSFRYPQVLERRSDAESGSREALAPEPPAPSLDDLVQHLTTGQFEVICLVEGEDAISSNTLQARHSYTVNDIVVNGSFQRCVSRDQDGTCVVDFERFHEIIERGRDGEIVIQSMP